MVFTAVRSVLALLVLAAVADAANEVKVNSFTFDGTRLTGSMSVANIAFAKVVNVIYANNAQSWGNVCAAGYTSGPDSSNREVWSFNCPISTAGITQFYVEYKVNGVTYYDNNGSPNNNYKVTTPTSAPGVPGTPGFQADITTWLAAGLPSFKQFMLANISPKNVAGALPGSIIAAVPGGPNNYVWHWIRDAGLVMDAVNELYKAGDASLEQTFWDHAAFNKRLQGLTTLTGLSEAKYTVSGGAFNDGWCRPQHDGPALRASSFIRFSKAYLAKGGSLSRVVDLWNSTASGVIKPDLDFVRSKFNDGNGCDLWEEKRGIHFFTVAVQRRAFKEAADFATFLGDAASAATYRADAASLDSRLATFWNSGSQAVQTTLNGRLLDAAIALGAVHGNNGDGVFAPEDDRVLASIWQLEAGFVAEYALNTAITSDSAGLPLSLAIGRYYGDTYDGANNSQGNPWYLTTLIIAETVFRAASAYQKAGTITVTALNQKLFNAAAPVGLALSVPTGTYAKGTTQFTSIIEGLKAYGDKHIRRVKFHGAAGFHFNEQYSRNNGAPVGVNDLTWSYAALLTTHNAREELKALSEGQTPVTTPPASLPPVSTSPATTTPSPATTTPSPVTTTPSPVTTAPAPSTVVSPTGFQTDISTYLSSGLASFKQFMLANISPRNVNGALAGSIIAATPGGASNYIFHWIRDAGLVMDVVNSLYIGGDNSLEQTFWDHASFTKRLQGVSTLTGLGEAKYYVNGAAFNDPWCRPQNDGPALRASSFIRFARAYLAKGGQLSRVRDLWNSTASGVIKTDLEYVTRNYNANDNCDLWEEIRGQHFFTVAVQRRALYEGRDFANFIGDTGAGAFYGQQAALLDAKLNGFWNAGAQAVQSTLNVRLLDAAIPLGAVHGNYGDGLFAPQDDKVLSSIFSLESGFINEYTLNTRTRVDASGLPLSVAIGRYYGDKYDGSGNTLGNPWYLTTAIVAETVYRAATAFVKAGRITVTSLNQRLFNGATPAGLGLNIATGTYAAGSTQFNAIIRGLQTYGDLHVRRVKYHGAAGFHLNEQYNRDSGFSQGVNDLTWSYGAMITVDFARKELAALTGTA